MGRKPSIVYPPGCTIEQAYEMYPEDGLSIYAYIKHRKQFGMAATNSARINQHIAESWFSKNEHEKLDPETVDRAFFANINPVRNPNRNSERRTVECTESDLPHIDISRDRAAWADAQMKELKLESLRGSLVNKAEWSAELFTILRDLRNSFQNIPVRVADTVAGMDDPGDIEQTIEKEMDEALTEFSDRLAVLTVESMEVEED